MSRYSSHANPDEVSGLPPGMERYHRRYLFNSTEEVARERNPARRRFLVDQGWDDPNAWMLVVFDSPPMVYVVTSHPSTYPGAYPDSVTMFHVPHVMEVLPSCLRPVGSIS